MAPPDEGRDPAIGRMTNAFEYEFPAESQTEERAMARIAIRYCAL